MVKQNNIYRIRKLTIGVPSALIASAFILSSPLISADEVTTTQENATTMTEYRLIKPNLLQRLQLRQKRQLLQIICSKMELLEKMKEMLTN